MMQTTNIFLFYFLFKLIFSSLKCMNSATMYYVWFKETNGLCPDQYNQPLGKQGDVCKK